MSQTNDGTIVRVEVCPRFPDRMDQPELKLQSQWGTADLVDEIAEEWRELCQEGPCNAPFYRPEWIAAAIRAFAGQQRFLLVTVRDEARLRGVLPLLEIKESVAGFPCTRLRSASRIPRFEFVHGEGPDVDDVVRAAWRHLRDLPSWDAIELVNVPEGGGAERLLAVAKEDAFPTCRLEYAKSPYIDLKGLRSGDDFSRFGQSSRFRYHLRQGWREISKRGAVRLQREEKLRPDALQDFYRLEQSGWKGKEGTAITSKPELRRFFDAVAHAAEQFGYLSMYSLKQGDTTIAAHLGLTYAERYYPIKVAYDEHFSKYGPGHLIIGQVLHDCVERGLTEFDCLGEGTEAKAKWTSKSRLHTSCSIFRTSAGGRILWAKTRLQDQWNQTRRGLKPLVASARAYVAQLKKRGSRPPSGRAGSKEADRE